GGQLPKVLGELGKEQRQLREAQEDLAMVWLENIRISEGQKFSDIVDKLVPIVTRGVESASGVRKADLLAYIGWAYFRKSRDDALKLDIDGKYREALRLDPDNPFAHAMWGHWLIVNGNHIAEAQQHFAAALKSGRERKFVRELHLAALQWVGADENHVEL